MDEVEQVVADLTDWATYREEKSVVSRHILKLIRAYRELQEAKSRPPAARLTAQDVEDCEPSGNLRLDVFYATFADALNAILGERGGGSEPCQLCGGTGRREKREYADTEMPYWNGQVVEVVALAIRRAIEEAELNPAAERDGRDRRLETAAALDALDEEIANG